jgi:beta-glucanase (GH16 family)
MCLGKQLAFLLLLLPALACAQQMGRIWTSAAAGPWQVVWSDDFTRPGRPDPAKWGFETGFVRNAEPQIYRAENTWCERDLLVIEARRERVPNPAHVPGHPHVNYSRTHGDYTSASLTTRGLHSFRYGRFEIRGRIDTRPGLWPAFWFVGSQGRWPACGEIDLMEWYGGRLHANACWGPDPARNTWAAAKFTVAELEALPPARGRPRDLAGWSREFHTWTMEWDERLITLKVDGKTLNTIDVTAARVDDTLPFRQPIHLIINLAVRPSDQPEATRFPARLEVDWVRVWQRR